MREIDCTLSQVACQRASICTPWYFQTTPMLGMFPVANVCFRNPNLVIIWAIRRIKIIMKWVNPPKHLEQFHTYTVISLYSGWYKTFIKLFPKLFCVGVQKCNLPRQQANTIYHKITPQCIFALYNFKAPYVWKAQIGLQKKLGFKFSSCTMRVVLAFLSMCSRINFRIKVLDYYMHD